MSDREKAIETVKNMPKDATLEEIFYKLCEVFGYKEKINGK